MNRCVILQNKQNFYLNFLLFSLMFISAMLATTLSPFLCRISAVEIY